MSRKDPIVTYKRRAAPLTVTTQLTPADETTDGFIQIEILGELTRMECGALVHLLAEWTCELWCGSRLWSGGDLGREPGAAIELLKNGAVKIDLPPGYPDFRARAMRDALATRLTEALGR